MRNVGTERFFLLVECKDVTSIWSFDGRFSMILIISSFFSSMALTVTNRFLQYCTKASQTSTRPQFFIVGHLIPLVIGICARAAIRRPLFKLHQFHGRAWLRSPKATLLELLKTKRVAMFRAR